MNASRTANACLSTLNLGVRSALFMPVSAAGRHATWSQLILLTVLSLLIQFLSDVTQTGWPGQFYPHGLPGALFILPVVLLAAWIIAASQGQPEKMLLLAVTFIAISIPVDIAYHLAFWVASHARWQPVMGQALGLYSFYAAACWFVLATAVAGIRLLSLSPIRWLGTLAMSVLLIGIPLSTVYRNPTLWVMPDDPRPEDSVQNDVLATEEVFYRQAALLDKQLAALKAGQKGIIDLYFVGLAGYAGQGVFMKEVRTVSAQFDQHFDTGGRSVMLINHPQTALGIPIASVTSLGRSLKRIGDIMNREEDILFLFLTSHGSKDHRFSLEFGAMQFHHLTPAQLKNLLDASGIRQRVIVVSACYSGGFIDPVKDENSLIMTAAAADRNSFGCSNENDFTYFGRAYFDEALRKTDDFIAAFALAKPVIAEREKKENYDSSNPQIFIGKNIRSSLEKLAQQRKAGGRAKQIIRK